MAYWDRSYYGFYPRSKPRAAKGGIKAQSKRGQFGTTWWGQRWVEVLESFHIGGRLQRGRSYARGGQVLSIDVTKGEVKAKVQGSMATPYKVSIQLKVLSPKEWGKIIKALAGQALFTVDAAMGGLGLATAGAAGLTAAGSGGCSPARRRCCGSTAGWPSSGCCGRWPGSWSS